MFFPTVVHSDWKTPVEPGEVQSRRSPGVASAAAVISTGSPGDEVDHAGAAVPPLPGAGRRG